MLKQALTNPPCLAHPISGKIFILSADASLTSIGIMLSQIDENGNERPIAFISRALNKHEVNWTITELELLAICFGLKKLRHIIYGEELLIRTDHAAICHLFKNAKYQHLSPKLTRMLLFLQTHNIKSVSHVSGESRVHKIPDCISRYTTGEAEPEGPENDNIVELDILGLQEDNLFALQSDDDECNRIKQLVQSGNNTGKNKHCKIQNSILVFQRPDMPKPLPYIPKTLRKELLFEVHDSKLTSHPGQYKTFNLLSSRYYWHGMRKCVNHYVRSCVSCQKAKAVRQMPAGLMDFVEIPTQNFHTVVLDICGPYPRTKRGKKYAITLCCSFSRYYIIDSLAEATSEQIAKFLTEKVIVQHGMPIILQTDLATNFCSELMQDVLRLLGITHKTSTSYHWQTQGKCEKQHDTINEKMRMFIDSKCDDWDLYLPYFQFSLNCCVNVTTGYSPFYMNHAREPILPSEINYGSSKYFLLEEMHDRLDEAKSFARDAIEKSQNKQAEVYNQKRRHVGYNVGDKVLLRKFVRKQGRPLKLQNLFYGPYTVIEQSANSKLNYLLEYKTKRKTHHVWAHVEKLRPFIERNEEILQFTPTKDNTLDDDDDIDILIPSSQPESVLVSTQNDNSAIAPALDTAAATSNNHSSSSQKTTTTHNSTAAFSQNSCKHKSGTRIFKRRNLPPPLIQAQSDNLTSPPNNYSYSLRPRKHVSYKQ